MASMFGGGGNKQQAAMQAQQMALLQRQQEKIDQDERDQKAQILARQRAAKFGGMRSLISEASLGSSGTAAAGSGQATLGSAGTN